MKTSKAGIDLIKKAEGYRAKAYYCPAGILTIGYGHTRGVKVGMIITEAEAERLLQSDLESAEKTVSQALPELTQYQFDALVSFVFNLGADNFLNSTLLKKIKARATRAEICQQFNRWVFSGHTRLEGLVKRRKAESDLFFDL